MLHLQERVRELEARRNSNASTSSTPPSANPLGAPKPVVTNQSRRQPGGQPGPSPQLKQLLPPERGQETLTFVPAFCQQCQAPLPSQATPNDPPPTRQQVVELPPGIAHATD